jgi:membrane-bound metal-dependent hydrolase YbcI (DUF457 family)
MEPLTQALASVALSRAGLNRIAPHATPILIATALAPDLDLLSVAGGAATYLRFHRTLLHSAVGGTATAAAIAVIATILIRGRNRDGSAAQKSALAPFFRILAVCLCGVALHDLLDLCDASGARLLWPFRASWQGWYLAPNLDALILILLIAAMALPALFKLVSEEIGERKKKNPAAQWWAIAAFVVVGLYFGLRAFQHSQAIDLLQSAVYRGEVPLAVGAYPDSLSPFDWRGIAATDNTLQEIEIHLSSGEKFDPDRAINHYKPAKPQVLAAAENAAAVREFVAYARFPLASVNQTDFGGWHIELRDLRLPADSRSWDNVVAAVDVNAALQIQDEQIRFAH